MHWILDNLEIIIVFVLFIYIFRRGAKTINKVVSKTEGNETEVLKAKTVSEKLPKKKKNNSVKPSKATSKTYEGGFPGRVKEHQELKKQILSGATVKSQNKEMLSHIAAEIKAQYKHDTSSSMTEVSLPKNTSSKNPKDSKKAHLPAKTKRNPLALPALRRKSELQRTIILSELFGAI